VKFQGKVIMMLTRIVCISVLAASFCCADNFLIKEGKSADSFFNIKDDGGHGGSAGHKEDRPQEPARVIVEDVNPNSDLGQAIRYVIKEGQRKELAEMKAKSQKKKVVKKKVTKKKSAPKPSAHAEKVIEMSQMPTGETVKAKEAVVVDEHGKSSVAASPKDVHTPAAKPEAKPKDAHAEAPAKKEDAHGAAAPAKDEHAPKPHSKAFLTPTVVC
jgi:hypothetical protein